MTMRYSHLAPSAYRSAIRVLEERCTPNSPEYSWATSGQQPLPATAGLAVELPAATPIPSLS
jgi:hypothetical protein